jgi:hypothetical protein
LNLNLPKPYAVRVAEITVKTTFGIT